MRLKGTIPTGHIIWLLVLAGLTLASTQYVMRDIGYVYEEILPHQQLRPRTLVRGYVMGHAPTNGDMVGIREAHSAVTDPGCSVALSDQWPTFAVTCSDAVYPILSETYQGNWLYYVSYAWQGVFGHSLRAIRLLSMVPAVLCLLLLYLAVRRETTGGTALFAATLLSTNLFFLASHGFAYWFETVPMVFLLGGYLALPGEGRDGPLWPSVLLVSLAVSLKATVGIVALGFLPLWWPIWRGRARPWRSLSAMAVAGLVPLMPFAVHEVLCIINDAPHSSMAAYLAARQEGLLSAARLPGIVAATVGWLLGFGGNLSGGFSGMYGTEPILRYDLAAWFALALVFVIYRLVRRRATRLELGTICLLSAAVVMSILLYQTGGDLQAFVPVVPFAVVPTALLGVTVSRWLAERLGWGHIGLGVLVVLGMLYGSSVVGVARDAAQPVELLANRADQEATAAYLANSADGLPIVTTEHNHIGMVEHFTLGALRPVHAYFPLSPGSTGEALRRDLFASAYWLLEQYPNARYVLASQPSQIWAQREGSAQAGETDVVALRLLALRQAARDQGIAFVQIFAGGSLSVWQAVNKVGP